MSDYNLSGLNSRSFEQLIQAIAVKVFGPKVIVFGDGPDGGREATFDGSVPYPSKEQGWNGYGIVQAKFLQRPQGAPKDGEWALQQLRDELTKFGWVPRGPRGGKPRKLSQHARVRIRRRPDYYIFVTNAVLTPVDGQGTKDKTYTLLEEFKRDYGLNDFDVWDHDKICAYLDGYEDIRHGYEGFITTGDVLARVMQWLRPRRPDFEQVIYKFLQSELIADQYANLEQAGRATEEKVPIARVFVDLPAYDEPVTDPPEEEVSPSSHLPSGVVAEIVEMSKSRLDPGSVRTHKPSSDDVGDVPGYDLGRLVIVGGPGQGKTTISQFTCQLFRAAILKGRSDWVPVREVEDILHLIDTQCLVEGIELPTARRFPLRIVLNDFAKDLAAATSSQVTSVLSYIAARIKKRADEEVTPVDLRAWLKNYPWIVIFDGLDEVPASSNRGDVLKAIQDFRVEINELNADVLILGTTRPQGYSKDFAPEIYEHKWLASLSAARALHYARRLTEIRYFADKDRQERVMARLERAADTEATARLMRSPLQVTIMATLVGMRGQPPQERWGLFSEYYKVIYQREMERDIPASDILRTYKSDIDRIHNRVGLILQARSERSGETDARLSKQDFATVVADRLEEEGHEGPERDELQQQITEAATDRLVFLVGLQEDLIGFEIRSLQEFMAAEALMDEREEAVRRRLNNIAPVSNWRNVFLFAAGKCFADRQELRDTIYTLCAELNDSQTDEISNATLEGSRLAMDILEEGIVRTQPKFTKLFTRLALRALSLPPSQSHVRLAKLYDGAFATLYQEELSQRLASADFHRSLGAWTCLARLIATGTEWARNLGNLRWPATSGHKLDVLRVVAGVKDESWRLQKLIEVVPSLSPHHLLVRRSEDEERFILEVIKGDSAPTWFKAVKSLANERLAVTNELKVPLKASDSDRDIFSLTIHKISSGVDDCVHELSRMPSEVHDGWRAILAAARFVVEPTREVLSIELRSLAEVADFEAMKNSGAKLPWVLASCLTYANSGEDLRRLAEQVEAGDLGDEKDWEAAERRWETEGCAAADVEYSSGENLPFDRHIAERGFPFMAVTTWSATGKPESDYIRRLLELYERLGASHVRRRLAPWIFFGLSSYIRRWPKANGDTPAILTSDQLVSLLYDSAHSKQLIHLTALHAFNWELPLDAACVEAMDYAGRNARLVASNPIHSKIISALSEAFTNQPNRLGLLRLLSLVALEQGTPTVPSSLLNPEMYTDPEFRTAAILTRLAQQQLTMHDAERVAGYAAGISETSWSASAILYMVEIGRIPFGNTLDRLLLTLFRELPASQWLTLQKTVDTLDSSLKRRTSGLEETEVWERLGFRTKLSFLVG